MKELIPMNNYGIFADMNDTARVDSRYVAEFFEKRHDHVIRDIEYLILPKSGEIAPKSGISIEFAKTNFGEISYVDGRNRMQKAYALTRDGFTILAMGYTGKKAMRFKELYIRKFNEMEEFIQTLVSARNEFPLLTENIRLLHDNPKAYHFSNECNMLNRIVLGKTAKEFRLENDIPKGQSIRPYLNHEQIQMIEALQKVDIGLLVAFPNYQDRKKHLEWYKQKLEAKNVLCERKL